MILIGIDPGTQTGMAAWNTNKQEFISIRTLAIHQALREVLDTRAWFSDVEIYIEDPNTWKPFGKRNDAKLQGAGSIKRDFAIWKDFCEYHKIKMHSVKLQGTQKKLKEPYFKQLTKWKGRTSEHARDAAMLVFGRKV